MLPARLKALNLVIIYFAEKTADKVNKAIRHMAFMQGSKAVKYLLGQKKLPNARESMVAKGSSTSAVSYVKYHLVRITDYSFPD